MVGVAGGSKGCLTCRKRKIKCDLEAPVCLQCIRSRRQCSGPKLTNESRPIRKRRAKDPVARKSDSSDLAPAGKSNRSDEIREHKFVVMATTIDQLKVDGSDEVTCLQREPILISESSQSATLESAKLSSSSKSSRSQGILGAKIPAVVGKLAVKEVGAKPGLVVDSPHELIAGSISSIVPTNTAMDGAYFQGLLSSFMDRFCTVLNPWVSLMPSFVFSTTPALTYAARAVVVGHFSRLRRCPELQLVSAQLYVQALGHQNFEVARSVGQPSVNDDIVVSSLLLGIYEAFCGTNMDAWSELMKGCIKLFELQGPHAFKTGYSALLFQSARTLLTVYVLACGLTSFLATPDWLSIPFEMMPEKPPQQTLNDILLGIPRYQSLILSLRSKSQLRQKLSVEQRMAAAAAYFGLVELRTKLDDWLSNYKLLVSGIDSDNLPDSLLYTENYNKKCDINATYEQWMSTHMFKPPLVFKNDSVASLIPLYYAALGIIQRCQCLVYDCAQEFPCGRNDLVTLPFEEFERHTRLLVARYNRLICQSVEYMIGAYPAIAAVNIVYPLKMAEVFLEDSVEKYWASKWCEKLDKLFGLAISIINVEGRGSDNMMMAHLANSLPICPHCGEVLRADGQNLIAL
ncbi:hypothetical protein POJ06DRAFT_36431 [Lipomyces tetrasporus]|uniref:Zn(2)-C6 fungal-type domain-containing protein n=1 Tax=Lipomyces tetrasporus TaxID=54092 RepID=A0AAD7QLA6_9ASCO|nr:uncharacterized protein POJ06DRAFT_36431 [Lipomyces tetrasporus]KAJ8096936.1 hypothetical protein POJ06DRAFT_36431 [Lipomyces tetrasporus]